MIWDMIRWKKQIDCLVAFVNDQTLEMLTNEDFKAASHRVHSEGQKRFSMVYEMRSHHVA